MSELEITPSPRPDQDDSTTMSPSPLPPPALTQSSTVSESREREIREPSKPAKPFGAKFSIWPPTQRTREAVMSRLIETLSSPSILSKRYGTIPQHEAASVARVIEEDAYATAGGASTTEDDGIEVLQVYSKEISKRMLDAVKARSTPVTPTENGEMQGATPPVAPTAPNEEVPTLETES